MVIATAALLLSSCAAAEVDGPGPVPELIPTTTGATGTPTTAAASPTTAPDEASIQVTGDDGVSYTLRHDGECYNLTTTVPGFEPTIESSCEYTAGYWYRSTPPCYHDAGGGGDEFACDVPLAQAIYGHVTEDIGWLCLPGSNGDSSWDRVSYVAPDGNGMFVAVLADDYSHTTPFPFTADGRRWGEPPLDAPASFIYTMCESAPPWEATVARKVSLLARIQPDSALIDDYGSTGLVINAGFGEFAVSLNAGDGADFLYPLELYADTTMVDLAYYEEHGARRTPLDTYQLPAPIVAELGSGWLCTDAPVLSIDIGASVATGDPNAVSLGWLSSAEASAIANYPGQPTDRPPGEPCPDTGEEYPVTSTPQVIERVLEGSYRFVIANDVMTLGANWMLTTRDVDGRGFGIGLTPASLEDETWESYLFPGTDLALALEPGPGEYGEPDWVTVAVPDLPSGYGPPYILEVRITAFDSSGDRPALRPEDLALGWVGE